MTANAHATLKKTKFFLNINQADKSLDDRLADFLLTANEWFEGGMVGVATVPITVTTQTTAIASQYAAGLWEQINSQDKSKIPANIRGAEAELAKMVASPPATIRKKTVLVADDPRDKKIALPTQSSIYAFDDFA